MEMQAEKIISFVDRAPLREINQTANSLPQGPVRRNGIDKPVVASRIVGRVACDLHVGGLRFPVGPHINSVLSTITVVEMHNERTLKSLCRAHLEHIVPPTAIVG